MSELTELERAVLNMMLGGDDQSLSFLRRQLDVAQVIERRFTKVGFYTIFAVKGRQADHVGTGKVFVWGDVVADTQGIVVAFELHLRDSYISSLEGFTFGDDSWPSWPAARADFKLRYATDHGNLDPLRAYLEQAGVVLGNVGDDQNSAPH